MVLNVVVIDIRVKVIVVLIMYDMFCVIVNGYFDFIDVDGWYEMC